MKKKIVLIVVIVAMLVVAVGAIAGTKYYTTITAPVNVYKKIATESIGSIIDASTKVNTTRPINLFANINIQTNLLNEEGVNSLENLSLIVNAQADTENSKYVLKVISSYMDQKLLTANVYMDAKENKLYLYAMELLDKYIELDSKEFVDEGTQELMSKTPLKIQDKETLIKILKNEAKGIISESMCSQNDGIYTLNVTNRELAQRLKAIIMRLSANPEFINCFENTYIIKDRLNQMLTDLSELEGVPGGLEVRIYTEGVGFSVKSLYIKNVYDVDTKEVILGNLDKATKTITYKENGMVSVSGTVACTKNNESMLWTANLGLENGKKINLTATTRLTEIQKVDEVNYSKVTKISQLTQNDMVQMGMKISNPIIIKGMLPLLGIGEN